MANNEKVFYVTGNGFIKVFTPGREVLTVFNNGVQISGLIADGYKRVYKQ